MNTELNRAARLLDAQAQAAELFAEIEARKPVEPGRGSGRSVKVLRHRRPPHHPREQKPSDICSDECRN